MDYHINNIYALILSIVGIKGKKYPSAEQSLVIMGAKDYSEKNKKREKNRGISDGELLWLLKKKGKELGSTPSHEIIRNDENMPSPTLYGRRFGSWNKACEMAGLIPNRYKKGEGNG